MRFATICTVISLLATPLAIIAAPAPAPAALANPEPHGRGGGRGGHSRYGSKKNQDSDNEEEEEEFGTGVFTGSPSLATGGYGIQRAQNQNGDELLGGGNGPAPTLLPGSTGNGNVPGSGDDDEEQQEYEVDDDVVGGGATATGSSNFPEETG
ncbi:MAG: hypothetical protein Q9169_003068 [Polycauliona sp. 2 TL-2023]